MEDPRMPRCGSKTALELSRNLCPRAETSDVEQGKEFCLRRARTRPVGRDNSTERAERNQCVALELAVERHVVGCAGSTQATKT